MPGNLVYIRNIAVEIVSREEYSPQYRVEHMLTWDTTGDICAQNYWLAKDHKNDAEVILSLGREVTVTGVEMVNTRNCHHRDRGTQEFKVHIGDTQEGPWHTIVSDTLPDERNMDILPLHTFAADGLIGGSFVKFEQISRYGNGGGLQYFAVITGHHTW